MACATKRTAYHDLRIEPYGHGATYRYEDGFTVYGSATNGPSSVLAGTESRCWLGHFDTLAEAQDAFPDAVLTQASSFDPMPLPKPAWLTAEYEAENERWEED